MLDEQTAQEIRDRHDAYLASLTDEQRAARQEKRDAQLAEVVAAVRDGTEEYFRVRREMVAYGFDEPLPDLIDDMLEVCRIIEVDPKGLNVQAVMDHATAWAKRELTRAKIRERAKAEVAAEREPSLTVEQFREAVGWQDSGTWRNEKSKQQIPDVAVLPVSEWRKLVANRPNILRRLASF